MAVAARVQSAARRVRPVHRSGPAVAHAVRRRYAKRSGGAVRGAVRRLSWVPRQLSEARGYLCVMCGRYATSRSATDLTALFDAVDDSAGAIRADYNVAPTKAVPIVRMSGRPGLRVLSVARWGLVPPWARDLRVGARMINARAERVATAPAFSASFRSRRCLVPADGWYEWRRHDDGPGKQAYFLTPRSGGPLAFAGLWAGWGPDHLLTCSVLTVAADGPLAQVHERMPLQLPADRWSAWLAGPAEPEELLAPVPPEVLADIEIRPVGPAVGQVRSNGPELTMAIAADDVVDLTLF